MLRNNRLRKVLPPDEAERRALEALGLAPQGGGASNAHHDHALRKLEKPDVRVVKRWQVIPSDKNPRKVFPRRDLVELGKSIREIGQIQPAVVRIVSVRPDGAAIFELVVGEKRWRSTAPEFGNVEDFLVDVRVLNDTQAMAYRLAENAKRKDVTSLEFAQGLRDLYESLEDPTWQMVADAVDLSLARVEQYKAMLKVLDLPEEIRSAFYPPEFWEGEDKPFVLGEPQGRALLYLDGFPILQKQLFSEIMTARLGGERAMEKAKELLPGTKSVGRKGSTPKPLKPKPNVSLPIRSTTSAGGGNSAPWATGVSVGRPVTQTQLELEASQKVEQTSIAMLFVLLAKEAEKRGPEHVEELRNTVHEYLNRVGSS